MSTRYVILFPDEQPNHIGLVNQSHTRLSEAKKEIARIKRMHRKKSISMVLFDRHTKKMINL